MLHIFILYENVHCALCMKYSIPEYSIIVCMLCAVHICVPTSSFRANNKVELYATCTYNECVSAYYIKIVPAVTIF